MDEWVYQKTWGQNMDTSTHITMGFGLAGLAYLDPNVGTNPELASAIMVGTVIGSNAPDFDYGIKILKGNGMYTEHHRGISHSLPAILIWSIIISFIIFILFRPIPFLPLLFWTFLAVIFHILFDIFNAYGTQAGRPYTKKWLSLNFIPLFDPFIILVHIIGFTFWIFQYSPGFVFLIGYITIAIYLIIRYLISMHIKKIITNSTEKLTACSITPTVSLWKWDFVIETDQFYKTGRVNKQAITWKHIFKKHDPSCPYIRSSLKDRNVKHFLTNSKHVHALYVLQPYGYEVRWIDLRFRHNNHYPYMAIVMLNINLEIVSSFTGWIYHSKNSHKKLIPSQNRKIELER